jgi:MoxR-like ATPase
MIELKTWLKANLLSEDITESQLLQFFPNLTIQEVLATDGDGACELNLQREQEKSQQPEPEPQPEPVAPVATPAPVKPKPAPIQAPVSQPLPNDPLAPLLAYIQANTQQAVNPDDVQAIVDARVNELIAANTKTIEVKNIDTGNVTKLGRQHFRFERVLKLLKLGNLYLYGNAGTGKSHMAEMAANAFGLPFYCEGVGPQSSQAAFKGYQDVNGNYVTTQFRQAWETGGVFCLDEVDAGNPAILLSLNMARSKKLFAFPDGLIPCHPDFYLVTTANTFGTGATREFVGRNQLDAAFLDGFFNIEIPYDEELEQDLYAEAAKIIQGWRKDLKSERVILSIRSMDRLHKCLQAGFTLSEAKEIVAENIPANLRSRII